MWEGNQVWLILGGGAVFAAWPPLYAVAFSGFYLAMLLLLAALILRPVGFTFRSQIEDPRWRNVWDLRFAVGGLVPSLVFGVAFGNVLQGVPFRFDDTLRMTYAGNLLRPASIRSRVLCGLVSVAMIAMHGGAYLARQDRGASAAARRAASRDGARSPLAVLFLAGRVLGRAH